MRSVFCTVILALALACGAGCATSTPLQVTFCDPVQLVDRDHDVSGLRLNLGYGNNRNVRGIDIGLGNVARKQMAGIQLGCLVSYSSAEDLYGVQLSAGLVGVNRCEHLRGLQLAACGMALGGEMIIPSAMNCVVEDMRGIQLAVIGFNRVEDTSTNDLKRVTGNGIQSTVMLGANLVNGDMTGMQLFAALAANVVEGEMRGVQLGALGINVAQSLTGIQIGAGNILHAPDGEAATVNGIQVGILNTVANPDWTGLIGLVDHLSGDSLFGLKDQKFRGVVNGVQIGIGNVTTELRGVQIGYWCNRARDVRGVQLAPYNYCRHLHGLQIGLINISAEHQWPCVPIVNARF